jgi:ABC-type maltose transport system permease subunit
VVQDFFFTMNSKYIARDKITPAVIFSFLTVLMSMVVLYNILNELDSERSIWAIIIYSLGIAVGTYVAMRFPGFKKRKRV